MRSSVGNKIAKCFWQTKNRLVHTIRLFVLCKRGILSELLINACRSLTNFNEIILLTKVKIYNYFA